MFTQVFFSFFLFFSSSLLFSFLFDFFPFSLSTFISHLALVENYIDQQFVVVVVVLHRTSPLYVRKRTRKNKKKKKMKKLIGIATPSESDHLYKVLGSSISLSFCRTPYLRGSHRLFPFVKVSLVRLFVKGDFTEIGKNENI